MANPTSAQLPQWLKAAQSDPRHLQSMLSVLSTREEQREQHRITSYNQTAHPHNPVYRVGKPVIPPAYAVTEGCKNGKMNRYMDIHPYDATRVTANGRYLNANWVRELHGGGTAWIAAQAPTPESRHAFLSAIREQGIKTVVQLTRNVEGGRLKADDYFPTRVGTSGTVRDPESSPLEVTLVERTTVAQARAIKSTVSVTASGQEAVVFDHYLYEAWPDHGVPAPVDRASLLAFIQLVHNANSQFKGDVPMVVGCSAGVGRTGSFIALSSLLRESGFLRASERSVQLPPLPESPLGPMNANGDKVALEIDWLREQRPGMVQRDEQVKLVYTVLTEAFAERGSGA